MAKILIIEDDAAVAEALADALESEKHSVEAVACGNEGAERLRLYHYDLAVVDWQLPGRTGPELVADYRARGGGARILMLTGRDAVGDRLTGLTRGADDYMSKPFELRELLARVRALMRRPDAAENRLVVGNLTLEPATLVCQVEGRSVTLLAREAALLEYFMRHPGVPLSVEHLSGALWSDVPEAEDAVRQCVSRLRKKLESPSGREYIETARGQGYVLGHLI